MVPVTLSLSNFMSYGEDAPELDFSQFQVACLSGRNGQGKSALLDAMTWALWGEARKASDARKPDETLLRHGARQMRVALTFDVGGERYRATRIHQRTKGGNGKTTLEVQVMEEATGAFRPLTTGNLRDTDAVLEGIVGIDYRTFINSAFLLQGRSDEFTRKKATDRKQILTGILDLGRYDQLLGLAGERMRQAKAWGARTEVDVERLKKALEPAAEWKEQRAACADRLTALDARLAAARQTLADLDRAAALREAQERELTAARERLAQLSDEATAAREDTARLEARLKEAEALIAQAGPIQADYDRHLTLADERQALDERRALHDALSKQIGDIEQKRLARVQEAEQQVTRLEMEVEQIKTFLADVQRQRMEAPAIRQQLDAASKAEAERDRLLAVRAAHEQRLKALTEVERTIVRETEQRKADVRSLEADTHRLASELDALPVRADDFGALDLKIEKQSALEAQRDAAKEQGVAISAKIEQRAKESERIGAERAEVLARIDRLLAMDVDLCPTCGTALTEQHRAQVADGYRQEAAAVAARRAAFDAETTALLAQRDALRDAYRDLRDRAAEYGDLAKQRTVIEQQRASAETKRTELVEKRRRLAAVQAALRDETFARDERQRLASLRAEAQANPFDSAWLDAAADAAGAAPSLRQRLRQIEEAAGREQQLREKLGAREQQVRTAREALDAKAFVQALDQQLATLRAQREHVGFDAARHDAVSRELRALREAPRQMQRLASAQQSREADRASLARSAQRIATLTQEHATLGEHETALAKKLAATKDVRDARQTAAKTVVDAEAERSQTLALQGRYQALLDQASADRKALAEARKAFRQAEEHQRLYKHLRQAFGQHGIPSLIIEDTLPEIEERANDLLGQLTQGRMSVRLETLKDKKSGGTKETLDIVISDEQGVSRPYETYSGGEAFRVNFALRIALSQLLAERSGVQIRTLCIDEGFGTQDEEGIEHLVEAIQAVQGDFDKIIVITHLGALKQAFPVRIEVEKRAGTGSTFELIGV